MSAVIEVAVGIVLIATVAVAVLYFVCLFTVFPFLAWLYQSAPFSMRIGKLSPTKSRSDGLRRRLRR